jgi:uroporphyrinogen decarboxylase
MNPAQVTISPQNPQDTVTIMEINLKKDKMTKGERWAALFNRQPLDRIAFYGSANEFAIIHTGLPIAAAYNQPEDLFNAVTHTAAEFGWQDLPIIIFASMGAWEFGGAIEWPTSEFSQAPMVTRRPVNSEEDVDKLRAPDVKTAGIIPLMLAVAKMQEERSTDLIMVTSGTPWGLAANICGVDRLCRWALKKPDLVHRIQQKLLPFSIALLRYWVDTFGTDRLFPWLAGTSTASNNLISPKLFEQLAFPYIKELYDEARIIGIKHVFCHICGEQNLNLPYWSQLYFGDPGVLSFGHEIDLETATKYFPQHIIMGNIEPAVIQTVSPKEVYELTKTVIEKGRRCSGGFILAPGCAMPPRAPERNLWAIMQAVSDFGWYE